MTFTNRLQLICFCPAPDIYSFLDWNKKILFGLAIYLSCVYTRTYGLKLNLPNNTSIEDERETQFLCCLINGGSARIVKQMRVTVSVSLNDDLKKIILLKFWFLINLKLSNIELSLKFYIEIFKSYQINVIEASGIA